MSPLRASRESLKMIKDAASPFSKNMATEVHDAFEELGGALDASPDIKKTVRPFAIRVGGVMGEMVCALDNVYAETAALKKSHSRKIKALEVLTREQSMQMYRLAVEVDKTRAERALTRLRIVTDELERVAVATALRNLKKPVPDRKDCTFYRVEADVAVTAAANTIQAAWLPAEDPDARKSVTDQRGDGSTRAHPAFAPDVTIGHVLCLNKLAKGKKQRSTWPAISTLQSMQESKCVHPQARDDEVLDADDLALLADTALTTDELKEYNDKHRMWHRGCTAAVAMPTFPPDVADDAARSRGSSSGGDSEAPT